MRVDFGEGCGHGQSIQKNKDGNENNPREESIDEVGQKDQEGAEQQLQTGADEEPIDVYVSEAEDAVQRRSGVQQPSEKGRDADESGELPPEQCFERAAVGQQEGRPEAESGDEHQGDEKGEYGGFARGFFVSYSLEKFYLYYFIIF